MISLFSWRFIVGIINSILFDLTKLTSMKKFICPSSVITSYLYDLQRYLKRSDAFSKKKLKFLLSFITEVVISP